MVTDTSVTVESTLPTGGISDKQWKLGTITDGTKSIQNDTLTVLNASEVAWGVFTNDTDGSEETVTISSTTITLTSTTATSGNVSGLIIYK